jgi:hypothetical protein
MSLVTTMSGITKGSATNSLAAHRLSRAAIGLAASAARRVSRLLLSRSLMRREDRFDISAF